MLYTPQGGRRTVESTLPVLSHNQAILQEYYPGVSVKPLRVMLYALAGGG